MKKVNEEEGFNRSTNPKVDYSSIDEDEISRSFLDQIPKSDINQISFSSQLFPISDSASKMKKVNEEQDFNRSTNPKVDSADDEGSSHSRFFLNQIPKSDNAEAAIRVPSKRSTSSSCSPFSKRFDSLLEKSNTSSDFCFPSSTATTKIPKSDNAEAAIRVPSERSTSSPFSKRFDSLLEKSNTSSDFCFPSSTATIKIPKSDYAEAAIRVPSKRSTSSPCIFSRRFDSLLDKSNTSSDFCFPSSTATTKVLDASKKRKGLDESNKKKCLDESKKKKCLDESMKRKCLTSAGELMKQKCLTSSGELAVAVSEPMVQRQTHFLDLPISLIYKILSKLPTNKAATFPVNSSMLHWFIEDPSVVDESIIISRKPLKLKIDWELLHTNLLSLDPDPNEYKLVSFVKGLLEFHRFSVTWLDLRSCRLNLGKPFTALTLLRLWKVTVLSIEGLVQNLPSLETLLLKLSVLPTWFNITDENSCLSYLMMEECVGHKNGIQQDIYQPLCRLFIKLDRLKTFAYKGMLSNPFDVICGGLEKASLMFTGLENATFGWERVVHLLLRRMRAVKELHIGDACLQNIWEVQWKDSVQPSLTPFSNLALLNLVTSLEHRVTDLGRLLQNAPKLERINLGIATGAAGEFEYTNQWETVNVCLDSLVYFQMDGFTGFRWELDFLYFILRSSPRLLLVKVGMLAIDRSLEFFVGQRSRAVLQDKSREIIEGLQYVCKGVQIEIFDE